MGFVRGFKQIKAERDWDDALRRADAGEQFRVKPAEGEAVKSEPPPVPMPKSNTQH